MLTRRSILMAAPALILAPATTLTNPAQAAKATGKSEIFIQGDAAINGFDPVAFFTQSEPVKGDTAHKTTWKGAEWRFASAAHKAMFETDPDAYAPQYGGYCAYAAALNYVAPTDARAWSLHDGKLYLNFSRNIRRIWEDNKVEYIARADQNWPGPLFA